MFLMIIIINTIIMKAIRKKIKALTMKEEMNQKFIIIISIIINMMEITMLTITTIIIIVIIIIIIIVPMRIKQNIMPNRIIIVIINLQKDLSFIRIKVMSFLILIFRKHLIIIN